MGGKGAMDGADRLKGRPGVSKQVVCERRAKPRLALAKRLRLKAIMRQLKRIAVKSQRIWCDVRNKHEKDNSICQRIIR
jgi:hypothetical protein